MNIETREGLFALMEQIAEEREAARPVVEQLVASGEGLEDIEIPEGWRTAGFVLELVVRADVANESEPRLSLKLADLGLVIATQLQLSIAQTYLEISAWREIGFAHRYLCTYNPAALAFENAARKCSLHPSLVHARATVLYAKAGNHFLAREHAKSHAVNASARRIFEAFGDQRALARCDVLDGLIAFRRGDAESARVKLEGALETLRDFDDDRTVGVVNNDLGATYRVLGRNNDALAVLRRARDIAVRLGLPSEVNRADWNIGVILLETGRFEEALATLRRIRTDYIERGMTEDAAEVGLCIIDGLVALNELETAKMLAESVIREFSSIEMAGAAMTALAYLHDILKAGLDARPAARHVRQYMERLRWEPEHLFLPNED